MGTPSAVQLTSVGGRAVAAGPDQRPQASLGVPAVGLGGGFADVGEQLGLEALLSKSFGQAIGPGLGGRLGTSLGIDQDRHPIGVAGNCRNGDNGRQSRPPQAESRVSFHREPGCHPSISIAVKFMA